MVREKYDWNISDLGKNIKTKGKKPKRKIEQTKAKLKRPRSTGKEHTSQEKKHSEYVTRRKKQRKSKSCSCKFTECSKLDENELEKAFEAFYKIGDSEKQKLNLLSNQDKKTQSLHIIGSPQRKNLIGYSVNRKKVCKQFFERA